MANPLTSLTKVGEAKLEFLFWDIYSSELYTQSGEYSAKAYPIALKIHYLRDIKSADLVEKTQEEWEKLGFSQDETTHWIAILSDMWPNIKKGDELILKVEHSNSSTFFINNEVLGSIDDPNFGDSFLAIWLDEKCSFPALRRKLIGQ